MLLLDDAILKNFIIYFFYHDYWVYQHYLENLFNQIPRIIRFNDFICCVDSHHLLSFFSKHFVVVLIIYNKPRLTLVYITSLVLLPRFQIDSLCKSAFVLQLWQQATHLLWNAIFHRYLLKIIKGQDIGIHDLLNVWKY